MRGPLGVVGLVAALAGCGVDPADAAFCADAPVLVWNNFGQGFVNGHCQPCHASGSTDRQDAPEDVVFDTEDQVLELRERVLLRAGMALEADMPPGGGVDAEDREGLEIWLRCYGG